LGKYAEAIYGNAHMFTLYYDDVPRHYIIFDSTRMKLLNSNTAEFIKYHEIGHIELEHYKVDGYHISQEMNANLYALYNCKISLNDYIKSGMVGFYGDMIKTFSKRKYAFAYFFVAIDVILDLISILLFKLGIRR